MRVKNMRMAHIHVGVRDCISVRVNTMIVLVFVCISVCINTMMVNIAHMMVHMSMCQLRVRVD